METYKDHITLSPDMNEERLNTLRELFPDWFTQEGFLDINEVKKAANPNSVDETERYEFRWFGKTAAKMISIVITARYLNHFSFLYLSKKPFAFDNIFFMSFLLSDRAVCSDFIAECIRIPEHPLIIFGISRIINDSMRRFVSRA